MLLSIIIVSYNEEKYIPQAIESCLMQVGIDDYEIIIGDDGSSDNSLEIIKEYKQKYPDKIKYFIMDRDETGGVIGAIRASNVIKTGLAISTGKYINVLSADDFFCDNSKFKKSISLLEDERYTKYSAAVSQYKKVWDDGREEIIENKKLPFRVMWSGGYVHVSCFVFKRDVFRKKLLLSRFCDDTGLIFSIGLLGDFIYLDDVMFAYRQRAGSIMHKSDELELCILELLLLQDIFNIGNKLSSSLARMSKVMLFVCENRSFLKDKKYTKYMKNAGQYKYDILSAVKNCNVFYIKIIKILIYLNERFWIWRRSLFKRIHI